MGTSAPAWALHGISYASDLQSTAPQVFAFLRRPLSVEIPVPAYICRYSLERSKNATRVRSVGVQEDLFQIAPIA